jgi:hypothetical protein
MLKPNSSPGCYTVNTRYNKRTALPWVQERLAISLYAVHCFSVGIYEERHLKQVEHYRILRFLFVRGLPTFLSSIDWTPRTNRMASLWFPFPELGKRGRLPTETKKKNWWTGTKNSKHLTDLLLNFWRLCHLGSRRVCKVLGAVLKSDIKCTAVESVDKSSDSDSSIFKTSDSESDSSIFRIPTPASTSTLTPW